MWTVVGLAAWFRDGCCLDPPLQEYQAPQQGSYPCPGTQAGPPGVIATSPNSTAPTNEQPAWIRGPSSPSNKRPQKICIYQLPFMRETGGKKASLERNLIPRPKSNEFTLKGTAKRDGNVTHRSSLSLIHTLLCPCYPRGPC